MVLTHRQRSASRLGWQDVSPARRIYMHGEQAVEAFVYARRRGGLLVVLPSEAIPEDELRDARAMSYRGVLGPSIVLEVEQDWPGEEDPTAEQTPIRIPVLVVDMRVAAAKDMHLHDPDSLSGDEMLFVTADSLDPVWPLVAGLRGGITDFLDNVQGAGQSRAEGYATALESAPSVEAVTAEEGGDGEGAGDGAPAEGATVPKPPQKKALQKGGPRLFPKLGSPPPPPALDASDPHAAALAAILATTKALSGEFKSVQQRLTVLEKGGAPAVQARAGGVQLLRPPAAPKVVGVRAGLGGPSLLPSSPPRWGEPPGAAAVGGYDEEAEEEDVDGGSLEGAPGGAWLLPKLLQQTTAAISHLAKRSSYGRDILDGDGGNASSSSCTTRGAALRGTQRR